MKPALFTKWCIDKINANVIFKNTYLNSGLSDHRPSPRWRWNVQISWSSDLNKTVSELGSLWEKCLSSSAVVACPSVLHCVAMKSLNSESSCLWLSLWMSCTELERSSVLEYVWAFLVLILARRWLDEVFVEPCLVSLEEVEDNPDNSPAKWVEVEGDPEDGLEEPDCCRKEREGERKYRIWWLFVEVNKTFHYLANLFEQIVGCKWFTRRGCSKPGEGRKWQPYSGVHIIILLE